MGSIAGAANGAGNYCQSITGKRRKGGWNEMKNLLIELFITALTGFFAALGVAAALLLLSLFV